MPELDPPPSRDEWDTLADRAARGLVRKIQRHQHLRRRKRLALVFVGLLVLAASGFVVYQFRAPISELVAPLQQRVSAAFPWGKEDAPAPDRSP